MHLADDLALMADTVGELQRQLNLLSDFCQNYKLKLNESKTKLWFLKMVVCWLDMNHGPIEMPN